MSYLFGRNKLREKAKTISTDDILPFIQIIQSWHHDYHHGTVKLPNSWRSLNFADFVSTLKTKLTLAQKDDLLELWNKYQPRLATLAGEIKSLDHQIDTLVYKLHNLTADEIRIIEGEM
ncbi:hypothetical protein FWC31_01640 [Candidatus Saccharibacteria bacterium]|nr:hypothetical protein [Candidatus Saccharibacteria bacterium]